VSRAILHNTTTAHLLNSVTLGRNAFGCNALDIRPRMQRLGHNASDAMPQLLAQQVGEGRGREEDSPLAVGVWGYRNGMTRVHSPLSRSPPMISADQPDQRPCPTNHEKKQKYGRPYNSHGARAAHCLAIWVALPQYLAWLFRTCFHI